MNIFEQATRKKIRFPSDQGLLSVEDLWDLKLTRTSQGASLDSVYKSLNRQLKEQDDDSLVSTGANKAKITLELQIEIIKHIADVKQEEKAAAENRATEAERRDRLMSALANKQDEKLASMTEEEIKAELAKSGLPG